MARPSKYTVDYFPHDVKQKMTLYIVQQKYGNNGYAIWWKTLEILGQTPGHSYDCSKLSNWQYIVAYWGVDEKTATEIIRTLAELDALDYALWEHRILWSNNFVARLADVYGRRHVPLPTRPDGENKNYDIRLETKIISDEEKQKIWCRQVTNRLVEKGIIQKHPCCICGETSAEAHHEDYSDPYSVVWICPQHHNDYNNKNSEVVKTVKCIHLSGYSVPMGNNNSVNVDNNSVNVDNNSVNVDNNHQSKLNKSKVNNLSTKGAISSTQITDSSFSSFLNSLRNGSNKISVLASAFKEWHKDAPVEDFDHDLLYGYIGKMAKRLNGDYGYFLKIIWDTVPASISGSHLNYINAMISSQIKKQNKESVAGKIKNAIPSKYKSPEEIDQEYLARQSNG